ncbi:MAG: LysM peptidoglycan-binding domain-containing protein [Bacteroidetes bacterium]|nr:MAG: LysM peptidoglycan-binding domain-containing protein [Bacteroidota bacterium]
MRKLLPLILNLFLLAPSLSATGDSLEYLTPKDTVFIQVNAFGEKYFRHVLAPGQTLFSLAKFYGMTLGEVFALNPGLTADTYAPGDSVAIPIPNRAILRYPPEDYSPFDYVPVCYVVQPGDTFYRICKQYFRMPLRDLARRNRLLSATIAPGQILHVGWMSRYGIPDSYRLPGGPLWQRSNQLRRAYAAQGLTKKEFLQKGAAWWDQSKPAGSDLYALHDEAPRNSIIEVRNPNLTGPQHPVYLRVIGPIPDHAFSQKPAVVISHAAAKLLNASEARFFVEVRYHK